MICVHYDIITGKSLGAFDSKMDNIPTPNVRVTEEYWADLDGKEKKVVWRKILGRFKERPM